MSRAFVFPPGFLWGAATASHQVEGDNRWNDWWDYERTGRLPFESGSACRHYETYEDDLELARSWGHNAHRFSIEWSRIEPEPGVWNEEAVGHYRAVLDAIAARGMEPLVTLHHFTNPKWFLDRGGWVRADSPRLFGRYAAYVVTRLGRRVKYWITVNEPTVYVMQGYVNGKWPPLRQRAWLAAVAAIRNLARAHVEVYGEIHAQHPQAKVGFAHSAPVIMPCDPRRRRDRAASYLRDLVLNESIFALLGARSGGRGGAARNIDFVGVNYYSRSSVRSAGLGVEAVFGAVCKERHHAQQGELSAIGWECYPQGLEQVLQRYARLGRPILVTENGIATDDERLRCRFLREHLRAMARAMRSGARVIGYLYWTLMDNYEWALGTSAKFGLAAVDFATQRRSGRPCAEDFSIVCKSNEIAMND